MSVRTYVTQCLPGIGCVLFEVKAMSLMLPNSTLAKSILPMARVCPTSMAEMLAATVYTLSELKSEMYNFPE